MTLHIKQILHIDVTDTADQWELFTEDHFAEVAANGLNRALEMYVNQGMKKDRVREMMHIMMANYAKVGANDSEPRAHLEFLLNKIFGN